MKPQVFSLYFDLEDPCLEELLPLFCVQCSIGLGVITELKASDGDLHHRVVVYIQCCSAFFYHP